MDKLQFGITDPSDIDSTFKKNNVRNIHSDIVFNDIWNNVEMIKELLVVIDKQKIEFSNREIQQVIFGHINDSCSLNDLEYFVDWLYNHNIKIEPCFFTLFNLIQTDPLEKVKIIFKYVKKLCLANICFLKKCTPEVFEYLCKKYKVFEKLKYNDYTSQPYKPLEHVDSDYLVGFHIREMFFIDSQNIEHFIEKLDLLFKSCPAPKNYNIFELTEDYFVIRTFIEYFDMKVPMKYFLYLAEYDIKWAKLHCEIPPHDTLDVKYLFHTFDLDKIIELYKELGISFSPILTSMKYYMYQFLYSFDLNFIWYMIIFILTFMILMIIGAIRRVCNEIQIQPQTHVINIQ